MHKDQTRGRMTSVSPLEPLNIHAALTTKPMPLDQVLPGLLARTVGMLAGPGGVGKTMLELQVAMALASGTHACGGMFKFDKPAPTVFVAAEEDVRVLTHRLHAVAHALFSQPERSGVDIAYPEFVERLHRNLRLYPGGSAALTLVDRERHRTQRLDELVKAARDARLVLIDPMRQFHDLDENDSSAMNAVVLALRYLAQSSGAAVVFAHHVSKAATYSGLGDVSGAARGSSALTDGVRWQLNLSRPSKEQAHRFGIAEDSRGGYLLLDLAKANYTAFQSTGLLERQPGGVLMAVASPSGGGSVTRRSTAGQLRLAGREQ